jgi:2-methylfumaryl-CoA hydratase
MSMLPDTPAEAGTKTSPGRFFEDFTLGETIRHATPRTVTAGDVALYTALYGSRFAVQSSDAFARSIGYQRAPVDDLLVFHIVFGKTVPDVSLNAVANLGYAAGRFLAPVYPGDTLRTVSEVIGLKENSNRQTGVVYVRSTGLNQRGDEVLDYVRWVMVRKRDPDAVVPQEHVPTLPRAVAVDALGDACPVLDPEAYDLSLAGSSYRFADYAVGERIDHVDGMTVEEAEHQLATRLYQNTARVHFDQVAQSASRFGRRLIYGGHVISLARALSFNGLGNAFHVAAINAGRHVAPLFAGGTVYAWSEVLEKAELPGRDDVGALRVRTIATRDRPCRDFPSRIDGDYAPEVILDLDLWLLLPR